MAARKTKTKVEAKSEEPKLTDKQKLFISYYLQTLNATQAAKAAGYSEDTARNIGCENLTKPNIRAEINRLMAEKAMPKEEVIARFNQQARSEHAQFWRSDFGELVYVDMKALVDAGYGHLIKSVTRDAQTGKVTKIEFYDAQAALVHIGKIHKMFTDRTEVSGKDGGPIQTEDVTSDEKLQRRADRIAEVLDAARRRLDRSGVE